MPSRRPKLFLVDGTRDEAASIERLLGGQYIVSASPPAEDRNGEAQPPGTGEPAAPVESPSPVGFDRAEALLEAIGEGVALADSRGGVVWANQTFRALPDEIRERIESVCREAAAHFAHAPETTGAGGAPVRQSCKFEIQHEQHDTVYDIFVTPAGFGGTGPADHVAVLVRDVTEARRTRRKMDAIDRAGAELIRLDADEIRRMNSFERLKLLENKITRFARELLSYDHFIIFLADERTGKLEPVISVGLPPEIQDLEIFTEEEGSGISGFVAATGTSYICTDATNDERFLPGLVGARSSLTVPLRLNERIIGILDIESKRPGSFTEQDRQFVEIFARHIALALHMLDLLVAERSTTNETVSDRFRGELSEPLEDIASEVDWLRGAASRDPETARHISRIMSDVESIRRRVRDVAAGPQTLLGVERAMMERSKDPLMVGRRILIADDQPKIRKVIGDILGHRGCDVTVCQQGQEAIDHLKAVSEGAERPFDLVISDIQMPDRNGYEVFSAVRKHCPGAPVILMTGFGYDPHHSIVRASQEGLQSVLFKPFDIDLLMQQVRKALTPEHASS